MGGVHARTLYVISLGPIGLTSPNSLWKDKLILIRSVSLIIINFRFEVRLKDKKERKIIDLAEKCSRLPEIYHLFLRDVPDKDEKVKLFLQKVAPTNMFMFNFWGAEVWDKLLDADYYLEELERVCMGVSWKALLHFCSFSDSGLQAIIKASCNLIYLHIDLWKLNLDSDIDLSGPTYKIEFLSFNGCGINFDNDWENKPDRFERVIKAIANSDLKNSLRKLDVCGCGITVEETQQMLDNYNLSNIQAYDTYNMS